MWSFRSVTGGAGCTTVSVATAVLSARRRPTLFVDLRGDGETLLGMERAEIGLAQWFDASRPPPDALARLEVEGRNGLAVLPLGPETGAVPPPQRVELLARLLAEDERLVIIDVGTSGAWSSALVEAASRSIVVTRLCYLSMARAVESAFEGDDGVVLVREPARLVTRADIERAFGTPVVAAVRWDPAVSGSVDLGTLGVRVPRPLRILARRIAAW